MVVSGSAKLCDVISHRYTPKGPHLYSATFIFAEGNFDADFARLDQEIAAVAKSIPGYLGEESWENTKTGLVSNVYYWETLEALQQLVQHPAHLEAKSRQSDWLAGYQVVIAKVLRIYGDSLLNDRLPVNAATDSAG
jgi:heme-degrading monooxygenase HmoA